MSDVELSYFPLPRPEDQVEHNHLMIIAVNHYQDQDIPNLLTCIKDGETIINVLVEDYYFKRHNIYYLRSSYRDEGVTEEKLTERAEKERAEKGFKYVGEATHRNIVAQMKELAAYFQEKLQESRKKDEKAKPKENIILMFSGHGIYEPVLDEGYWIPTDAVKGDFSSYVENSTIRTIFRAMKTHHSVLISDSCYSGSLFPLVSSKNMGIPKIYQHASRWGLTAGRKNETVSEGIKNSPFAEKLIEILSRKHEVWIGDLGSEIIKQIGESKTQTPMSRPLPNMPGDEAGQFVFLPRTSTEKDRWDRAWRQNEPRAYHAFLAHSTGGAYDQFALEALSIFAGSKNKKPKFTENARTTYGFFAEVLPNYAKTYLTNYLRGNTQIAFRPVVVEMYQKLLKEHNSMADVVRCHLKSFILGRVPAWLDEVEKKYLSLRDEVDGSEMSFLLEAFEPKSTNPYKGLEAYGEEDVEIFFGRRSAVQDLRHRLKTNHFVLISAPSYTGKTSVIKAGLFPELRKADPAYGLIEFTPGFYPSKRFQEINDGLLPDGKTILLIDQYEQLFAVGVKKEERDFFEAKLLQLYDQCKAGKLYLILNLRSDHEWQFSSSTFGKHLLGSENLSSFRGTYRLPAPTQEEWREIIQGPAWTRGADFEPEELVDDLVKEVKNTPNGLALLSLTLQVLFTKSGGVRHKMTRDNYRQKLGGINGALDNFVNEIVENFSSDIEISTIKKIFLRMVEYHAGKFTARKLIFGSSGGNILKDYHYPNELSYSDQEKQTALKRILDQLRENRLVAIDTDALGHTYIKPFHELLVSQWSKLRSWVDEFGQENLILQRELWQATLHTLKDPTTSLYEGIEPGKGTYFSKYWDSNLKLGKLFKTLLDSHYHRVEFWEAIRKLPRKQEMSYKEERLFERLLKDWEEQETVPNLDDFIQTGISVQVLNILLKRGDHWLNQAETNFVSKSWQKRIEDFTRLKEERNEALTAKRELAIRTHALMTKYREQSQKDLLLIKKKKLHPDLYLILVGTDEYQHREKRFKGCEKDVNTLAKAFGGQKGKLFQNVYTYKFINADATKKNIIEQVEKIQGKDDMFAFVLLFFAGGGAVYQRDAVDEGINVHDGAFLPYDFDPGANEIGTFKNETAISGTELCSLLMQFKSKVILILDIGHGAEFLSSLMNANRSGDPDLMAHNVFGLSASGPGEDTLETAQGGIFSIALSNCFDPDKQEADLDKNGVVYLDELVTYTEWEVKKKVKEMGDEQNVFPVFPSGMTNIPLIQFAEDFALPREEIAFTGHIDEKSVVQTILKRAIAEERLEGNTLTETQHKILGRLEEKDFQSLINELIPVVTKKFDYGN